MRYFVPQSNLPKHTKKSLYVLLPPPGHNFFLDRLPNPLNLIPITGDQDGIFGDQKTDLGTHSEKDNQLAKWSWTASSSWDSNLKCFYMCLAWHYSMLHYTIIFPGLPLCLIRPGQAVGPVFEWTHFNRTDLGSGVMSYPRKDISLPAQVSF